MIDAQTFLEHVQRDGERIAQAAGGHLDATVPTCPDYTVGTLLVHTAGVCWWWKEALLKNAYPGRPAFAAPQDDPIGLHRRELAGLLDELARHDPDEHTWTWFPPEQNARFAYRRAAQELSIHRWDVENAVGGALPIDPTLAADGTDEFLQAFCPKAETTRFTSGAEMFGGDGEVLRFEATDVASAWTLVARPDRFDHDVAAEPDVIARADASTLNLFVWGRLPVDVLDITGDQSLIDRWSERVKI
jgi:uncharacterized protein (TIGR03083 family)